MTTLKILLLTTDPSSGKGGIATSVANCAAILKNKNIPFEVIASHSPSASKAKNTFIFLKALLKVALSNPQRNIYYLHVGPKGSLIRKTILSLVIKIKDGKTYTHYHSPAFLDYLHNKGFWKLTLATLSKCSYKNLALNNYWKNIYETHLKQQFSVLPNPLGASSATTTTERQSNPKEKIMAICAARLVEDKNIQELILLTELNKNITLTIIGGGNYEDTLHQLANKSTAQDRITFTGWLSNQETKSRLSEADIFILPSKYDSFGMVYIEALSEGVPVIAPSIPAVIDTLHGLKGVAHASSATEINNAIDSVINTPASEIKESVKEKYGEEIYLETLLEITKQP